MRECFQVWSRRGAVQWELLKWQKENVDPGVFPAFVAGMKKSSVIKIDPEIMSGTPCFVGTRVPARALIDYLEAGKALNAFFEDFPSVSRKQAVIFLEEAGELMLAAA